MEKQFNSQLLQKSYENNGGENNTEIINSHSFIYTVLFLNKISANPEIAKAYGIDDSKKIDMIKDFYGINDEHRRLSLQEIAEKYNKSVDRAKAMMVNTLRAVTRFAKEQSNHSQISK